MIVGESRFWNSLWKYYGTTPSIAFCRVPELEYASQLDMDLDVLDHCCGDGIFASLAWPGKTLSAGCDIQKSNVARSDIIRKYQRVDVCDVSQNTPYPDESFDMVFNNSALEHISNLDAALIEVARVLKPKGRFAFNVLNHRYFSWWPLGDMEKDEYRLWQPFYHALSVDEWGTRLEEAGFQIVSVDGYFDKNASQILARLDYLFSAYFFRQRRSLMVSATLLFRLFAKIIWRAKLAAYEWDTNADGGAGYFIQALRVN